MQWLAGAILFIAPVAYGITDGQTGLNLGVVASLDFGGENRPIEFGVAPGVAMPITVWRGHYDSAFALGRYWGGGLTPSLHVYREAYHLGVPIHIERGMDLIAIAVRFHGGLGPLLAIRDEHTAIGATLRAGASVKYRLNRNIGPELRIQIGADYLDGQLNPRAEVQLGFDLSLRIKPPAGVND